jgi:hypothetical protein
VLTNLSEGFCDEITPENGLVGNKRLVKTK